VVEGGSYRANRKCDLVTSCSKQEAQLKGREKVAANAGNSERRVVPGVARVSTRCECT